MSDVYRIDNLDSASRITAKNWLIDEGVLVPVTIDSLAQGIWEYLVVLSPPSMKGWLDIKDVRRGIYVAVKGADDE